MFIKRREHPKKHKNRSNKINLVFDEEKRREFLTGFHKRKLQRKKEAEEKLKFDLKAERKRLKNEAKESYKKLVVSHRTIPELDNLIKNEYEENDVTVKVIEMSTDEIAKQNNWIGANQPKYICDNEENQTGDETNEVEEQIPGMELHHKIQPKKEKNPKKQFNTKKDVKKALKKEATQKMQNSKIFQKKNKLERQKQKKKALKVKKQTQKFKEKRNKKR